jgi:UDP:flavonoid glycosyltransferase YjiC (YdhE family)
MEVVAETAGPMGRTRRLASELVRRGHDVLLCSAQAANYRPVEGVPNHLAPTPSPLGLPMALGRFFFRVAQAVGAQRRARVGSFEQVLRVVGVLDVGHFSADVAVLREAIRRHDPHVVYSEFRLAAIVAAKLEGRRVVAGHSYPTRTAYAARPDLSAKLRAHLQRAWGLPATSSILDVFEWADARVVASSPELEPVEGANVVFTGPFSSLRPPEPGPQAGARSTVVLYMGNGTVVPRRQLEVAREAFPDAPWEVCLASAQLPAGRYGRVEVRERIDFRELLPRAAAFVNHGGQNSVMDGLVAGVPQVVCPGGIFERIYNADSVVRLGAGRRMEEGQFDAPGLRAAVEELSGDPGVREKAQTAGRALVSLGGVGRAAEVLERMAAGGEPGTPEGGAPPPT